MKKIIITIKPQHLCNELNGIKTIEVRKNENLANAVKKIIGENGECRIKCACSKSNEFDLDNDGKKWFCWDKKSHHYPFKNLDVDYYNGAIVCEIVINKVEEIKVYNVIEVNVYKTDEICAMDLCKKSCLTQADFERYLGNKNGYALHIKSVIPYEKPQENKRVIQNYAWVEE